uniref:Uncharacterized protein n=1 Tax=Rhizophora mucronata TaxID=61149 RepID=A0A2P2N8Y8_RHIMU
MHFILSSFKKNKRKKTNEIHH